MTYLLLDLIFLGAAAIVAVAAALRNPPSRLQVGARALALLAVLVLTAIFDNVMIGVGLVAYNPAHTSGLRLGLAPVEDFAYPIAAALLLPALWTLLPGHRDPVDARHSNIRAADTRTGGTSTDASTGTGSGIATSTGTGTSISTSNATGMRPATFWGNR